MEKPIDNIRQCHILYVNAQSFLAHRDEIIEEMFSMIPRMIVLRETRTTLEVEEVELYVPGYIVPCDSSTHYTGGVLVYVRNDI